MKKGMRFADRLGREPSRKISPLEGSGVAKQAAHRVGKQWLQFNYYEMKHHQFCCSSSIIIESRVSGEHHILSALLKIKKPWIDDERAKQI